MPRGIKSNKFRCMACQKLINKKAGRYAKYNGYKSLMCPSCAKQRNK